MNEDLKTVAPEQENVAPVQNDVPQTNPEVVEQQAAEQEPEQDVDLTNKGLKELVDFFQELLDKADVQKLYKYADGIKVAFYKTLRKEKITMGFQAPAESEAPVDGDSAEQVSNNPFAEIERGFKDLYAKYKVVRADYLQELNSRKDENYQIKSEVVEELKALVENPEDINKAYPIFRELQSRWRMAGAVPAQKAADLYESYSHYVEMFYDYVKINREFRDLDFKKNLEAKQALCEKAEQLGKEDDVRASFRALQALHEQWKELGPVDKEQRDSIWERFKTATAVVNKKYQEFSDSQKEIMQQNYVKKVALCEKIEALAETEMTDAAVCNSVMKELEALQQEWRSVGFAAKKDNQKVYDRFRAACTKIYDEKRAFFNGLKGSMMENAAKKAALCEQAEAVVNSEDWKKTTDFLVDLQKQWKEIGPVSRRKSEALWNRFRAACDTFFNNRDKHFGGHEASLSENLAAKKALVEEINAYEISDDSEENNAALKAFQDRWAAIGFVPIKEKEVVQKAYSKALESKFGVVRGGRNRGESRSKAAKPLTEKDRLIAKFLEMKQNIATWENNIGFFTKSKNAEALLADLNSKIDSAKAELAKLEEKIKSIENQEEA